MNAVRGLVAVDGEADDDRPLLLAWSTIRGNVPLLLFIDLAILFALLPALAAIAAGGYVIAPVVAAVSVGPFWIGAIAAANELNCGEDASPRCYLRLVRRNAVTGIVISLVPAVVMTILLATLAIIAAHPGSTWLLVPLLADGSVAILILIGCLVVYSYGIAGLCGRSLWAASLAHSARQPVVTGGTGALLVLIGLAVTWLTPTFGLLAAPFAVLISAMFVTSLEAKPT